MQAQLEVKKAAKAIEVATQRAIAEQRIQVLWNSLSTCNVMSAHLSFHFPANFNLYSKGEESHGLFIST